MKLDLYQKQLLRSISDLVVYNPYGAYELFQEANNIDLFDKINAIQEFILEYQPQNDKRQDCTYINGLQLAIDKLDDKEVKKIFKSSIDTIKSHAY